MIKYNMDLITEHDWYSNVQELIGCQLVQIFNGPPTHVTFTLDNFQYKQIKDPENDYLL